MGSIDAESVVIKISAASVAPLLQVTSITNESSRPFSKKSFTVFGGILTKINFDFLTLSSTILFGLAFPKVSSDVVIEHLLALVKLDPVILTLIGLTFLEVIKTLSITSIDIDGSLTVLPEEVPPEEVVPLDVPVSPDDVPVSPLVPLLEEEEEEVVVVGTVIELVA